MLVFIFKKPITFWLLERFCCLFTSSFYSKTRNAKRNKNQTDRAYNDRRLRRRRFAGITVYVGFASFKVVFQMPRSFRLFSKTVAFSHSREARRSQLGKLESKKKDRRISKPVFNKARLTAAVIPATER
jgi:hypothetical protein